MKRFLALCLSIIMVFSLFSVTALAATISVPAEVLVDQSFKGLDDLSNIPSTWAFEKLGGSVTATADGIAAVKDPSIEGTANDQNGRFSIYKKEAFNTNGASYTFKVTITNYTGTSYVHLGAQTAADAVAASTDVQGYTFTARHSDDYTKATYKLYKNGIEVGELEDNGSDYGFCKYNRTFVFKVSEDSIVMSWNGQQYEYANGEYAEDTTGSITQGYIGGYFVNQNDSENTRLAEMSLSVDGYKYETVGANEENTGAYARTREFYMVDFGRNAGENAGLPDEVVEIYPTGYKTDIGMLYWSTSAGQAQRLISLGEKSISCDNFMVDAQFGAVPTQGTVNLNFFGYTLECARYSNKNWVRLKQGSNQLKEAELSISATNQGHVRVLVEFSNGMINVYLNGTKYISDANDLSPTRTGVLSFSTNKYAKGNGFDHIGYYEMDSTNKRSAFKLDKDFNSADDSCKTLGRDGWRVARFLKNFDDYGIYYADATKAVDLEYAPCTFGGAYTAQFRFKGDTNPIRVRTNIDAINTSYYELWIDHKTEEGTLKFDKVVNGTATTLDSVVLGAAHLGKQEMDYKVSMKPQTNGDMKIELVMEAYNTETDEFKQVIAHEVTDLAANNPLTEGKIGMFANYAKLYIDFIKVYPTSAPNLVADGVFNVNGSDVNKIAKGKIAFGYTVAELGTEDAQYIAALYEDGKMTDVRFLTLNDINRGYAYLFDTTASTAAKTVVKLFKWNSVGGMIPLDYPWVLE